MPAAIKAHGRRAPIRRGRMSEKQGSEPRDDEASAPVASPDAPPPRPIEIGGREGPDPTRYGDWEKNGRCIDF
jgi:hypothetical protein